MKLFIICLSMIEMLLHIANALADNISHNSSSAFSTDALNVSCDNAQVYKGFSLIRSNLDYLWMHCVWVSS